MEQERIWASVESIVFQNEENGFAVIRVLDENGDDLDVVGPLAGCVPGEELTLMGQYKEHSQYGRQFEAVACVYRMPEEQGAIIKYLSSGVLPGIGPSTARRIVEKFGEESLEVLANDPERLATVRGLPLTKARAASKRFAEMYAIREAMAGLAALGLTAAESVTLYRRHDRDTSDLVRGNPYILCGAPLYFGFARADAIAKRLGLESESAQRTRAAVLYTLRHNLNNGHCCLPVDKLLATASEFFAIPPDEVEQQLQELSDGGQLVVAEYGAGYVYLPDMLRAEMGAALRIREMAALTYADGEKADRWLDILETAQGIRYAPLQRQAVKMALSHGVMVITGGPGTGKTTAINAILTLFEQQAERVLLAAPTGRAAKRMSELTGRKATTIHRLLEAGYSPGAEATVFAKNSQNLLKCDVLVVDEVSMVDALLFESLLDALRMGVRLVLVGDANQLPSVGAGNVLKGILDSGVVPSVELTQVFRQAAQSLIVSNAHRIVGGEQIQKGGKNDDFFFLKSRGESCQDLVCDLVARRLPQSYGYSPQADIQVLCPGRKGLLGTEELNARLRDELNPPAADKPQYSRGGVIYRLGDKVMQVKNNYDLPFARADGEPGAGAFNGDIGIIEEVNPSSGAITVLCEDRHVNYSHENLHELEPAWAVTIHKSQGSEFTAVVLPLSDTPKRLRYRNLLYTGVTRAKSLCVLAGEEEVLLSMIFNDRKNLRYSCFADFLRDDGLV